MASRLGKSQSIVRELAARQTRGGISYNAKFPRSRLLTKYHKGLCIPLSDIQKDDAFASGHVLLGFTKSGEYLMSYCTELHEGLFGFHTYYTYTLHWWRFNLWKPLHEVCHVSLFVGEVIQEELLLIVCHTLNDNRVLVHGISRLGGEQSRQCYVTLCPSPSVCDDSWAVHMKYSLLPPVPMFIPSAQLQLKDTILLNTVDSILAVTITPHTDHKLPAHVPEHKSREQNTTLHRELQKGTTNGDHTKENPVIKDCNKSPNDIVLCPADPGDKGSVASNSQAENNNYIAENDLEKRPNISLLGKEQDGILRNRNSNLMDVVGNNRSTLSGTGDETFLNCEQTLADTTKFHFSSFELKTFCDGCQNPETSPNTSEVTDSTSSLDIQVTNRDNAFYRLIQNVQHNSGNVKNFTQFPDHKSPCVHAQVLSLDVESCISKVLNTLHELKEMYWLLSNYSTQIVDVCYCSESVILQVISLISVQPKAVKIIRRRRCSVSFLLSWSVSSGEVQTLDISSLVDLMDKTDKQIFENGRKRILDLREKCFVPSGLTGMQALSNHTVFTGTSLEFIKHPSQPIAIIL